MDSNFGAGRKTRTPHTPNFNEWEDVTLGRSFSINASCDPILGNNQRGNAFWGKVTELYHGVAAHQQLTDFSVSSGNTVHTTRSMDKLKNRFSRIILKELGFFHTHYNHTVQENPASRGGA
jgi:hypothetical protein